MSTNKGDIIMKYLLILFAMLFLFVSFTSCDRSITEPTPEKLPDGIAFIKAEILNVDYPSWTVSIKVVKLLNKGEGCPVWENDKIDLNNSPYDYITGQIYKLTIQYIPNHSGGTWVVVKQNCSCN